MKRYVISFAVFASFAASALAQDDQNFDPYAAYQKKAAEGEIETALPDPVEPAPEQDPAPEIVEAVPTEEQSADENAGPERPITQVSDEPSENPALTALPEEPAEPEPAVTEPAPASMGPAEAADIPPEKPRETPKLRALPVSPFYLTAQEYRAQRPAGDQAQLVLSYKISKAPLTGNGPQSQRDLTLILGKDFAFSTLTGLGADEPARLYDFNRNRILLLTVGEDGALQFSNASLYAGALRNTRLVSDLTRKGKADAVQAGPNLSLHPVWIESAMSYAMADRRSLFEVEIDGKTLVASFEDELIFGLTFGPDAYPSVALSETFLAYAHHALPVHPALLRFLYAAESPPQELKFVSYGPDAPAGTIESWVLTDMRVTEKGFPLPSKARSGAELSKDDPLVTILRQSYDKAPPSLAALKTAFTEALDAEDYMAAILAGQRYKDFAGDCAARKTDKTCTAIATLMARDDLPEEAARMAKAFNNTERRGGYVEAVEALAPLTDAANTPAPILFAAGITRAKIRDSQATEAGIDAIDPEPLLLRALALDPHNPSYLIGLAQLFAVKDRYEAAWDLHDSLRAVLAHPNLKASSVTSPIDRVEAGLEKDAPGYFLAR